jgi:hypothetical protein
MVDIEQFINSLAWSQFATDNERSLVAGNLRNLYLIMKSENASLHAEFEALRKFRTEVALYAKWRSDTTLRAIVAKSVPEVEAAKHRPLHSDLEGWFAKCSCGEDCETEQDWINHILSLAKQ